MTKHPYQTCLRMPLTLKEDMTTICDRYQINESDLMRRAIVEFVTNIQQNPNKTSRHMFVWGHTRTSLGYDTDIDLSDTMLRGLLRWVREGQGKHAGVFRRVGLSLRGMGFGSPLKGLPYGDFLRFYFILEFPYENPNHPPRTHILRDVLIHQFCWLEESEWRCVRNHLLCGFWEYQKTRWVCLFLEYVWFFEPRQRWGFVLQIIQTRWL